MIPKAAKLALFWKVVIATGGAVQIDCKVRLCWIHTARGKGAAKYASPIYKNIILTRNNDIHKCYSSKIVLNDILISIITCTSYYNSNHQMNSHFKNPRSETTEVLFQSSPRTKCKLSKH